MPRPKAETTLVQIGSRSSYQSRDNPVKLSIISVIGPAICRKRFYLLRVSKERVRGALATVSRFAGPFDGFKKDSMGEGVGISPNLKFQSPRVQVRRCRHSSSRRESC